MSLIAAIRVDICCRRAATEALAPMRELLDRHSVPATWCVATGPDRSGLALSNALLEPGFSRRMLRVNPLRTYGLRSLVAGTLLPAETIFSADVAKALIEMGAAGHEVALHGHDHRAWQNRIGRWPNERIAADLEASRAAIDSAGIEARGSAAPAWRATELSVEALSGLGLLWASDLRAREPLRLVNSGGKQQGPPQIPVNLPTCDELIAWPDVGSADRASTLAGMVRTLVSLPPPIPPLIYCAHPEVDALIDSRPLQRFVELLRAEGGRFATLGEIAVGLTDRLPLRRLKRARCRGRGGWVATDGSELPWLQHFGGELG